MSTALWQPEPVLIGRSVDGVTTYDWITERRAVDLSKLIACATCRATVLQSCRVVEGVTKGKRRDSHRLRFAPRVCECGSALAPQCQLCETCRVKHLREAKRDYMRRQRAAARRTVAA